MTQAQIHARRAATDVQRDAGHVEHRRWFKLLARVGLCSRSVIYVLIAYLTVDIAIHGSSPVPADGSGALREIGHEPAGPLVLFLVALGLLGYAIWRLVSAVAATDRTDHSKAKRFGLAVTGVLYLLLCAQAAALAVGSGQTKGASSNPSPVVATVLRWPGGPLYVGLCGVGFIAGGLALLIWGWAHDYGRILDRSRMTHRVYGIAHATGILGDSVRGLLIGLIGIYLVVGAVTDNPSKVKGLDQALQALAHKSFGVWLLSVAAAGLISFGLYSGLEARYRRL